MSAKEKTQKDLDNKTDFSHQAYCLVGDRCSAMDFLTKEIQNTFEMTLNGHPDFYLKEYDHLKLRDEDRSSDYNVVREEIVIPSQNRPVVAPFKIIAIVANSINENAQNALLKLLEEMPSLSKIFIILPSVSRLLPTIKSRIITINVPLGEEKEEEGKNLSVKIFLSGTIADRLALAAKILDDYKKEKITKGQMVDFFRRLEREVLKKNSAKKLDQNMIYNLKAVDLCRSFAEDQSPSYKALLEYLAIVL